MEVHVQPFSNLMFLLIKSVASTNSAIPPFFILFIVVILYLYIILYLQ